MEAAPSLESGYRPPIADGFTRFLAAPGIQRQLQPLVAKELDKDTPPVFATHPTFRQRSQRALSHHYPSVPEDNAPALSLFEDIPGVEFTALRAAFPDPRTEKLQPVTWDQIGPMVYVPNWRESAARFRDLLVPYRAGDVPEVIANLASFAGHVPDPKGMLLTREQRADRAAAVIWMAVALALLDSGWDLHAQPGDFYLSRSGQKLNPADLVRGLRQKQLSGDAYRALLHRYGVEELQLGLNTLA